jgi:1-acyl-sn-glycerol-3-phosphate acyltransferase
VNALYEAQRLPLRAAYATLMRIHASGMERMPRQGGAIVVSNHLNMLDPMLIAILMPRQLHFMAKEELFRFGPLGWWLLHSNTFPIRRGESDRAALRHAEKLLRAGEVVLIFPEGHRSAGTGAQAARAGAVLLARRTGAPIVPVAIAGTERLRLRQLPGHSRREWFTRPNVTVRMGEPIQLGAHATGSARRAGAELLMRRIIALLPPAYHGIYAEEG